MRTLTGLMLLLLASAGTSSAADRLCDTAYENCRAPLLDLIRDERVGVDVAFWFMEDARPPAGYLQHAPGALKDDVTNLNERDGS